MKKVRSIQNKKPRWLKILRQPFPYQIEKPHSTKKGATGYIRAGSKQVLKDDIEDMLDV